MTKRLTILGATGFLYGLLSLPTSASEFEKVIQPFFKSHCVSCHGPKKAKSKVRLDKLTGVIEDDFAAKHWQEILDVLNAGEMPPEDEPQPKTEELASVIAAMTDALHDARKRLVDPKSVTLRRLNKREYANTIQDLLGVPVDTSELPADGTLDGFDTIGDAHLMSTAQFEGYLTLAKLALDSALVNGPRPKKLAKRLEPEESTKKLILRAKKKMPLGLMGISISQVLKPGKSWISQMFLCPVLSMTA